MAITKGLEKWWRQISQLLQVTVSSVRRSRVGLSLMRCNTAVEWPFFFLKKQNKKQGNGQFFTQKKKRKKKKEAFTGRLHYKTVLIVDWERGKLYQVQY